MTFFQLFVLSLIQGVTEFLPVSSSGHLILASSFTGWQDQGMEMDVALHAGTLAAVVLYFFKDIKQMIRGTCFSLLSFLGLSKKHSSGDYATLTVNLIIATIPAVIFGALIKKGLSADTRLLLRSPLIIASASIGFGLLLYIADRWSPSSQDNLSTLSFRRAFVIGLFQAFAFIPGTSRSGVCMTAGRFLSLNRLQSARFAFLLSIPTILGAICLTGYDCWKGNGPLPPLERIAIAAGLSMVFGLLSIHGLLTIVSRISFTPFVFYRFVLGIMILFS